MKILKGNFPIAFVLNFCANSFHPCYRTWRRCTWSAEKDSARDIEKVAGRSGVESCVIKEIDEYLEDPAIGKTAANWLMWLHRLKIFHCLALELIIHHQGKTKDEGKHREIFSSSKFWQENFSPLAELNFRGIAVYQLFVVHQLSLGREEREENELPKLDTSELSPLNPTPYPIALNLRRKQGLRDEKLFLAEIDSNSRCSNPIFLSQRRRLVIYSFVLIPRKFPIFCSSQDFNSHFPFLLGFFSFAEAGNVNFFMQLFEQRENFSLLDSDS